MSSSRPGGPLPTRPTVGWLSPRLWGLHVLVVVAVAFTVFMGLWQMGVYDEKRAEAAHDQRDDPVLTLQEVLGPDDPFTTDADYQHVTFTGTYAPADEQVWVSGREHEGQDGYWLLAPVLVDDVPASTSDRPVALLVVRGWSPEAGRLPAVPEGPVAVDAVLQAGDARGFGFDEDERVIDGVRIPRLVNVLPYDLYGGYGIVTAQQPADTTGLEAATVPEPTQDSAVGLRNLFYAIEWWIFGAFALFMWWRMCRDIRRESVAGGAAAAQAARARARARAAEAAQESQREDETSPSSR